MQYIKTRQNLTKYEPMGNEASFLCFKKPCNWVCLFRPGAPLGWTKAVAGSEGSEGKVQSPLVWVEKLAWRICGQR